MTKTLPKNFFFGAAMSGRQTEGAFTKDNRLENIWDTWSNLSISIFITKLAVMLAIIFTKNMKMTSNF